MIKLIVSLWFWIVGSLFFIFSFIVIVLSTFALSRKKTADITRFLFRILVRLVGIRLEIKGLENVVPDRPCLIMGNHQSLFDIFVVPAAIPLCFVGVQASRHFSYPFFGYLIKKWGNIPIERNNLKQAIKSLEQAKQTFQTGMSIGIMPEGHRTTTGKMQPFKKGPFHLAKDAQADILPFGVSGLYQYNKKGAFLIKPGKVVVNIGKIIPSDVIENLSVDELRHMVFEKIYQLSR